MGQTNKQTNDTRATCRLSVLTQGCVGDTIHLQDEVVFEENVANDGEQVDEDERQHGGEHDGASVTSHTLDHVQQRLLSVDEVEQLPRQSKHKTKGARRAAISYAQWGTCCRMKLGEIESVERNECVRSG